MADLATGYISSELIDSQGYYFEDQDIETGTAALSGALLDGKRQNHIEIVGIAKSEVFIAAGLDLKVELQSAVYGGAYATFDTAYNATGTDSTGTTITIGTELFRVSIPSDADESIKVKITSAATNTGTMDVYDVYRA